MINDLKIIIKEKAHCTNAACVCLQSILSSIIMQDCNNALCMKQFIIMLVNSLTNVPLIVYNLKQGLPDRHIEALIQSKDLKREGRKSLFYLLDLPLNSLSMIIRFLTADMPF